MKFCAICNSIMQKRELPNASTEFVCSCAYVMQGDDDDSLYHSEIINADSSIATYNEMLHNSAWDLAANQVKLDCPKCKMDVMSSVRIAEGEITIITCRCGFRSTMLDYDKKYNADKNISKDDQLSNEKSG